MKYSYFPGCSLKGTGQAYEESMMEVFNVLDVEVEELNDWNCCGATAYMSVDEMKAFVLASRNLSLAKKENREMLTPCPACYLVLEKTKKYISEYPKVGETVKKSLNKVGLELNGGVNTRHPLDVIVNDIGLNTIKKKVTHPLTDLKVFPYYGCQIVRPYATFDDPNHPVVMDNLIEALGAKVVDHPLKTKCCGGSLTGTIPEVGKNLVDILMTEARKRDADVIAVLCPLCQFNLDAYQAKAKGNVRKSLIPIVYFTQLMGIAFGIKKRKLGLRHNIVSLRPILSKKKLGV